MVAAAVQVVMPIQWAGLKTVAVYPRRPGPRLVVEYDRIPYFRQCFVRLDRFVLWHDGGEVFSGVCRHCIVGEGEILWLI